ncbi:MAG: hypothetical protein L7F78_14115, partial [Syntrophales bacterium LBB04]|nr:hypothetical protein [Syntrophales bacterium LBB04]
MERTAKIIFSLVLLLRIAYLNQPIPANAASWIGIGPDGGQALAIAIDPVTPQTVYAATGGGVYKSTNSGQNWQPAYTGIAGIDVTTISALPIDPWTPRTPYAASP